MPDLAPETGGPVTVALGMVEALAQAGAEVRLFATDHGRREAPATSRCDVRLFPCRLCAWRWSPELGRALSESAFWADIAHVHTLWRYPTLAAGRACRRAGVPYLLRPAGMLDTWSLAQKQWKKAVYLSLFERSTIAGARALHWTSSAELDRAGPPGRLAPPVVAPPGLPPSAYGDLPDPKGFFVRFPRLEGRWVVLFLGRLHPKKQPDVAIRAFARVRAEFPRAALALAGDGEPRYAQGLEQEARRAGLGEVHFLGMLHGREVQQALVAAQVFVLPSLQENFGLAVVEAMAAGCPVVVSPQVALASSIEEHGAGLVAEANDEGFASALRRLLGDGALRDEMGGNARRLVLDRFTAEAAARRLVEVYGELRRRP